MENNFKQPHADYQTRVDDKLRFRIPLAILPEIEEHLPWIITSLDGEIVRMYPRAEWERAKSELRSIGEDGERIILFAEVHASTYGLDMAGRMLLPSGVPCGERLRGTEVRLVWGKDHIQILSEEQYRAKYRWLEDWKAGFPGADGPV